MRAFYNEIDPYAAGWLRNLIAAGHIAPGVVDTRSIEDIEPHELFQYTQCHFFAGVGVWSRSLRLAGWSDDRPVWTGSCPCQPFSTAGKGAGFDDERHLWPAWHHLISQCRPAVVFGEQVAAKAVDPWIDLVHADVEALGYAFGAVPFPSAGVGAPHIRDRCYWVADTGGERLERIDARGLGHADGERQDPQRGVRGGSESEPARGSFAGRLADDDDAGLSRFAGLRLQGADFHDADGRGAVSGFWAGADWLPCRDEKWRPVSALPQPLVDGSADSLGRVRPEVIAKVEKEVNAATAQIQGGRTAAMRTLLQVLGEEAQRSWPAGGIPRLHEAPFLLAFMRQLEEQGWGVAEGVSLPRAQAASGELRCLRHRQEAAGASHQRGLDGQQTDERADLVRVLSRLLARHTQTAWDDAYAAHAETGFPLARGARSRVGRLRAYGNAINAQAAAAFVESYLDGVLA